MLGEESSDSSFFEVNGRAISPIETLMGCFCPSCYGEIVWLRCLEV